MTDFTIQLDIAATDTQLFDKLKLDLEKAGYDDFVETTAETTSDTDNWSLSYYRTSQQDIDTLQAFLKERFPSEHLSISVKIYSNAVWQQAWEENFEFLQSDKFVFLPQAMENKTDKEPIWVAGGAFGSGEHATTKAAILVLERLLSADNARTSFLDVGTGTGIFAAYAEKLGFTKVVGTDIIDEAIISAKKTRELNNLSYEVVKASFPEGDDKFDIIACNILPPELYNVFPDIKKRMHSQSLLVIAGFNESNIVQTTEECDKQNFKLVTQENLRGWIALCLRL